MVLVWESRNRKSSLLSPSECSDTPASANRAEFIRPTRASTARTTSVLSIRGRYKRGVDQDEWCSLLETIRKQRSKPPLDGVCWHQYRSVFGSARSESKRGKVLAPDREANAPKFVYVNMVSPMPTRSRSPDSFRFETGGQNLGWGSTIPPTKDNAQAISTANRRLQRVMKPLGPGAPFATVGNWDF